MIISPSILSCNFLKLEEEIKSFNDIDDLWLHLDIMDGHFVPNLSFGKVILDKIPLITNNKLDAHFMVQNPDLFLEIFKDFPLYNFTFHWEAATHHDRLIKKIKEMFPSVGISLNPSTPISVIPLYLLKEINLILIMSVNPGFGGQEFIAGVVDKVKELNEIKEKYNLNFEIQVDGGVTDKNAKMLKTAGATNLVAGSFIFKEPNRDYKSRIDLLR